MLRPNNLSENELIVTGPEVERFHVHTFEDYLEDEELVNLNLFFESNFEVQLRSSVGVEEIGIRFFVSSCSKKERRVYSVSNVTYS